MSGFLSEMAEASRRRLREARRFRSQDRLMADVVGLPLPPRLTLHERFDLIAEVKLKAPSAGRLASPPVDRQRWVADRARTYADAGAAAISVLTEPTRFDGHLDDLAAATTSVSVPVMRKDFLVDPYQVFEARIRGAGGVLLIARMVSEQALSEMASVASALGMFVLLEAFDADDLEVSGRVAAAWRGTQPVLVGVNTRDLSTLEVDGERLERLASVLPEGIAAVAESGLRVPGDARHARSLGYRLGLVGSALMAASDAGALAGRLLAAGRAS